MGPPGPGDAVGQDNAEGLPSGEGGPGPSGAEGAVAAHRPLQVPACPTIRLWRLPEVLPLGGAGPCGARGVHGPRGSARKGELQRATPRELGWGGRAQPGGPTVLGSHRGGFRGQTVLRGAVGTGQAGSGWCQRRLPPLGLLSGRLLSPPPSALMGREALGDLPVHYH